MPKELSPVTINELKGLNLSSNPEKIDDSEFQVLENFLLKDGGLKKRPGFDLLKQYSSGWELVGRTFKRAGPYTYILTFNSSTGILQLTRNDYQTISSLNVLATYRINALCEFDISTDYVIVAAERISDGADGILRINKGSFTVAGFTVIAGMSYLSATAIYYYASRVWVSTATALYFSEPESLTSFPATNVINRSANTQQFGKIVPLSDNRLAVLTEDDLNVLNLNGSPRNWSLSSIHHSPGIIGVVSQICHFKGLVYFWGRDSFYVSNGANTEKLTDKLDLVLNNVNTGLITPKIFVYDEIENILILQIGYVYSDAIAVKDRYKTYLYYIETGDLVEFRYDHYPTASPWITQLIAVYPGVVTHGVPIEFIYAYSSSSNDAFENVPQRTYLVLEPQTVPDSSLIILYYSPDNTNNIYEDSFWNGAEVTVPVSTKLKTKEFDFGNFSKLKKIHNVAMSGIFGADIEFTYSRFKDYVLSSAVNKTLTSVKKFFKLPGPGYFKVFSFQLEEDSTDGYEILNFDMDVYASSEIVKEAQ